MTYLDLLRDADRQLDDGRITIGEYERMIKPLECEVQPEVVRCGECKYFEDSDSEYCNNAETYTIKTDSEFGCILGERRTDD
jgi:hypothetical protein